MLKLISGTPYYTQQNPGIIIKLRWGWTKVLFHHIPPTATVRAAPRPPAISTILQLQLLTAASAMELWTLDNHRRCLCWIGIKVLWVLESCDPHNKFGVSCILPHLIQLNTRWWLFDSSACLSNQVQEMWLLDWWHYY